MQLAWIKRFNVKVLAIGHLIFHSLNYGFDYVLYPLVIYNYGPIFGGVIMGALAAAISLFISWLYDFLKKDWLGIEVVKELVDEFFEEEQESARRKWRKMGKKIFRRIFHKNKIGQFLFLSINFDPLITVIYMRRGSHLYNGFSLRDWKIFWLSVIVSNAWWTGIAFVAVTSFKEIILNFF